MDIKGHLKTLSELHGPTGYEDPVREALASAWTPFVDELETGKMGTLVGIQRGSSSSGGETAAPRKRIMLMAHIDEVALIVNGIEDGFLKVRRLGYPDARLLPGTPITVHGRRDLPGVVGVRAVRSQRDEKKSKFPTIDDLFIDVGLPDEEVRQLVRVGDLVVPDLPLLELQNGRVSGKAIDDRACVAAITATLELLSQRRHSWDVLAVASTQEEQTFIGAISEANRLLPDLAVALDVTFATQPGVHDSSFELGGGPTLGLGPNFHPVLYDAMMKAADQADITVTAEITPGHSGTDAWPLQTAWEGIPTALIGIAVRNMHSTVETVDIKDIERSARWLAEFICGLAPDYSVVWDD
ncbi:MAG: M20/M25/M40 family metallo-hydrolase [Anaerolineae bacterium]